MPQTPQIATKDSVPWAQSQGTGNKGRAEKREGLFS